MKGLLIGNKMMIRKNFLEEKKVYKEPGCLGNQESIPGRERDFSSQYAFPGGSICVHAHMCFCVVINIHQFKM
jgi:hypothetical protein